MCYSLFFFGMLGVELAILLIQFFIQARAPSLAILYLVPVTAISAGLFLTEGLLLFRKNRPGTALKDDSINEKPNQNQSA
jgi:hypothetical protein